MPNTDLTDFPGPVNVRGNLSAASLSMPSGTIVDDGVNAAAGILATKLQHELAKQYGQPGSTDVTAATQILHLFKTAGVLASFEVIPKVLPVNSFSYTIDLLKLTTGSTGSSVLSAPLVIGSTITSTTNVARNTYAAAIAASTFVDGEALMLTLTTTGSAGSQGQGFLADLRVREIAI